jgi:two-component system response regulator (stage 0 sporulation protein F)
MPTVLIIDGYDLVRGSVKRILDSAGYKVIEVPNMREAPSVCALTLAEVVIIEVDAPIDRCLETIRELRGRCPAAAVIAISADGQTNLDMAKAAGATDGLAKPFDDVALIDAVTRVWLSRP